MTNDGPDDLRRFWSVVESNESELLMTSSILKLTLVLLNEGG